MAQETQVPTYDAGSITVLEVLYDPATQ